MSANDKELLELAAKAAGYGEVWYLEGYDTPYIGRKYDGVGGVGYKVFRPLEDDGDALRLAVRIGLDILFTHEDVEVIASQHENDDGGEMASPWAWESWALKQQDTYAATRRAIVRAAAEIGRMM